MENRKEQADAKYRQKFSELGLKDFENVRVCCGRCNLIKGAKYAETSK